jgi:hypothetical protein
MFSNSFVPYVSSSSVFENLMSVIQYHPEGHTWFGQLFLIWGAVKSRKISSEYET